VNSKKLILIVTILILGIILGALGRGIITDTAATPEALGFVPAFNIIGDIENSFGISSYEGFLIKEFQYKGESFNGITLSEIIKTSSPVWSEYEILLIGDDGLSALILHFYLVFQRELNP
jgi:hypothetical protein